MQDAANVTELLRRGIAAVKAGRAQEARQILLRVTELDKRSELAWLWLSSVVESLEDRRICLENVLAINPQNAHAQAGLRWLDQQAPPPPTAEVAEERCPRCESPVPPSGTTCPHCGQLLIVACPDCGGYVEVREVICPECGRFLGDFRDGARYHITLARAYLEQNRNKLVLEAADRAVKESPDDPSILREAAELFEDMGETDRAIRVYQQAMECNPGDAVPYARLGAIYRRRAMPDEARAMYQQAARLAPRDPTILFDLAQLRIEEDGITTDSVGLLEQIVRLDPEHAHAHLLLGDACLRQRQAPRAVVCYERACELTASRSMLGREARRKLARLRPSTSEQRTQGWGETLRRVAGLMLSPALAALVNARLVPWEISLVAWGALAVASVGAFLWACATDVPRNPAIRAIFGKVGLKGSWRKALVGLPGAFLWGAGLGAILWKV